MPVPRALSSSCGTCVRFSIPEGALLPELSHPEEIEQIVRVENGDYITVYGGT